MEIFSSLSRKLAALYPLRGHVAGASTRQEYVFEQGEDGDTFYIVIEGTAAVLRAEPGNPDVERELSYAERGLLLWRARASLKIGCATQGCVQRAPALDDVYQSRRLRAGARLTSPSLMPVRFTVSTRLSPNPAAGFRASLLYTLAGSGQVVADRCTEVTFARVPTW